MALPKGAKITRDGIEFVNNIDPTLYTMKELIRMALRDCGKLWCKRFKQSFYNVFRKITGRVNRYTQYWVRHKQAVPDLIVGIKPFAFYGGLQEYGSSKTPRYGLMYKTAEENIDNFIKLQSQYLSHLSEENPQVPTNEEEYTGSGDE